MEKLLQEKRTCQPITGLKKMCKLIAGLNHKPVNLF